MASSGMAKAKVNNDNDDPPGTGTMTFWCGEVNTWKFQQWWPKTKTTGEDVCVAPTGLDDIGKKRHMASVL